jgi:hypothetical protein
MLPGGMRQDTPKKRPVLTIAGVLLPAIGVAAAFIVGGGTPGLAAVALFVLLILGGAVLGATSTLLALVRGEPWRGLQATVLMVNVGVALFLAAPFLRGRPAPPIPDGEPAFLALAPAAERIGPQAIVLAYPAPDSPDAHGGYVIGQRDARGVVSSLRTADYSVPLKPGELRLQLVPANGRWTVRRDGVYIAELSEKKWQAGAYLEIRVNSLGWGVAVGIADQELRSVDQSR